MLEKWILTLLVKIFRRKKDKKDHTKRKRIMKKRKINRKTRKKMIKGIELSGIKFKGIIGSFQIVILFSSAWPPIDRREFLVLTFTPATHRAIF